MTQFHNLRTTSQLVSENPAFTEASLRWLIFNSNSNGLSVALVRIGRRVFIDLEKFNAWIESHRQKAA